MPDFSPTPQQQLIIETIRDKPDLSLMIDARAGSAKTTTIELAAQFLPPGSLLVAFNKRIAVELEKRVPSTMSCRTLNSIGHAAWAKTLGGKRLEVDGDKMFKIAKAVITMEDQKADGAEDLFINTLNLARRAKSAGLVPLGAPMKVEGIIPDTTKSWENIGFELGLDPNPEEIFFARQMLLKSIQESYQARIDYDDQIYMSVFFGGVYGKHHTVVVDEAQDLSPMNHLQLKKCVGTRLIAVGDPYQAIYGFRGADSNSMTNLMDMIEYEKLGLTYSFRCPKTVAVRQQQHVEDFEAWPTNNEGQILHWPLRAADLSGPGLESKAWSIADLPAEGAILCRNNAPLMKLAFAIIKTRRPVKILGRDIGANLANLLDRICSKADLPVEEAFPLVNAWASAELLKAEESESKQATIFDRRECLEVLLDASGAKTTKAAIIFIKDLFADKAEGLVLASGHKAKGLEWHWVMHLDPWRCPSKQAQRAMAAGNGAPMLQERNLQYVIETRTKAVLVFADLDKCEEIGE